MCENDGLADGQPEPVAGHLRSLRYPVPEERLEYAFALLRGDARPLVVHEQLQFAAVRVPSRYSDWGAWWRILGRVVDQVGEHALHLIGV